MEKQREKQLGELKGSLENLLAPHTFKMILFGSREIELAYLLPIAVVVLSEEEFDHLKKRERRIALDIDREGIPL
ncbi:MAG: hypothetical protein JRF35_13345 [Deltaproteobacteria bacterium]|nr:hypothetical protein [Deltaproteobacteria bacterium]